MACRVLSTVLRRVQCLKPFSALLSAPAVERPQGEGQRKVLAAVLFTPVEPRTLEQAALAVAREVALRQVACHSPDTVKWISAMLLKTVTPPGPRTGADAVSEHASRFVAAQKPGGVSAMLLKRVTPPRAEDSALSIAM